MFWIQLEIYIYVLDPAWNISKPEMANIFQHSRQRRWSNLGSVKSSPKLKSWPFAEHPNADPSLNRWWLKEQEPCDFWDKLIVTTFFGPVQSSLMKIPFELKTCCQESLTGTSGVLLWKPGKCSSVLSHILKAKKLAHTAFFPKEKVRQSR